MEGCFPEQVLGIAGRVQVDSDVFNITVVLFGCVLSGSEN